MIPTLRAVLLLIFAAPLIALATWAPVMQWLALLYVLVALILLFTDWRMAGGAARFAVTRQHDTRLSLGADNPITLSLRNPGPRPLTFWLRDEPPDAFTIPTRILEGSSSPAPGVAWGLPRSPAAAGRLHLWRSQPALAGPVGPDGAAGAHPCRRPGQGLSEPAGRAALRLAAAPQPPAGDGPAPLAPVRARAPSSSACAITSPMTITGASTGKQPPAAAAR